MQRSFIHILTLLAASALLVSCKSLEKASMHGLNSGYYTLKTAGKNPQPVYLDVGQEQIDVYHNPKDQTGKVKFLTIPLLTTDSLIREEVVLKKQSLDVDITSILLKYRPSVYGLPAQINTDLNLAIYAGWRYDRFQVKTKKDPLGRSHQKISTLGYDFGFFAGPGSTLISPFTTLNRRADEYNGIILQTGIAGFLESNVASFGLSVGYDHLLNPDRKIWIYRNKPWVGFIVGIALN